MASLGELYFSLGLDDKQFNEAIESAKKKVSDLGAKIAIDLDLNTGKIAEQIQKELNKIKGTSSSGGTTELKVELDKDSFAKVQSQLTKLGEPIVTKIQVEYDAEKFQAVETAMKNFGKRVSESVSGGLSGGRQQQASQKGKKGIFERGMEYIFGDDDDTALQSKTASVKDYGAAIEKLASQLELLNKQQEQRAKNVKTRTVTTSTGDKEAQLRRLEEGVRRWQNVKANIESSKVDKESADYKKAISLIDAYIQKLEEAKKSAGNFTDREMTAMLGQTLSGKVQEANRLVKTQKDAERAVLSDFTKQQAQIQRFEESIRRIQNVKAKIAATDVDKSSSNYKQATIILDAYIDKLEEAKRKAGSYTRREMSEMTGQNLSGEIAFAERYIKAEKELARQKEQAGQKAVRKEKEEIALKKAKLQLKREEQNLVKATNNARKSDLQRQKEALRVKKERIALQKKLNKGIKEGSTWATQLRNQFNNLISIYSIERFVRNLYTIGGEFQKQHIALRSMIGDADKANVIFERTKDMAVQSPFTFSELASYTKQLSAYGIEYKELYDTTKRLADISAGVGVDMGRLILAYGQVRSAEVLRGQELRQFTEAGIPLVAELAKRLEEVRGKSVKVGEVFEAISKREISFGMVQDVLFDMTDPGGRFFEMQEELAKSLAGQWSNLKDAWDIMIADIAQSSESVLGNLSETARELLVSWRDWVPALMSVVGAIGAITSAVSIATIAQKAWTAAMAVNPWVRAASIILGVVGAIGGWIVSSGVAEKSTAQLNTELDKEIQKWDENRNNALRYVDTLKASNTAEERRIKLYQELIALYPEIFKDMKMEEIMLMDNAKLRTRINEETAKNQMAAINKELDDRKEELKIAKKAGSRKSGLGVTKYRERTKEEKQAIQEIEDRIAELELRKKEVQAAIDRQGKIEALTPDTSVDKYIELYGSLGKAVKILKQGGVNGLLANPKELTTTLEYYDQLNAALKDEEDIMKKFKSNTSEYKEASRLATVYRNAISAIGGVWKDKAGEKNAKEQAQLDAQAYYEELKRKLAEEAQKWNIYKQLFDVTGNKDLSMRIAFTDSMTFVSPYMDSLKKQLKEEAEKFGLNYSVTDLLGMGEKQLKADKSIPEAEREKIAKALGAIIEAYHSENKRLKDETIRDYIEIIKASKDFAVQIADVERKLKRQLETLENIHGKGTPAYEKAAAEAIKRAEEEKVNIEFEQFKESSDWVKVFDDLDRVSDATLDNMIKKVEEYARQANLSEKVTKQLVEAMGKLRDESIERNPFKGISDAWGRLKNLKQAKSNGVIRNGMYYVADSQGWHTPMSEKQLNDAMAAANEDLKNSSLAVADKFQAVANAADLLSGLFENLGIDLGGFGDLFSGIASGAQTGAGIASALSLAGPWGAIAGAALGMLSSVAEMHDKALQKEIEESEERTELLENISSNLESKLERTLGGIYKLGIDKKTRENLKDYIKEYELWKNVPYPFNKNYTSKESYEKAYEALNQDSYYDAQLANLMLQRDELKYRKELEKDKKKSDKAKLADYEQQITEMEEEIKNFAIDMANTLYGIDFKDWANQLASALVDAWASGEDAVEAYKNTVKNILKDLGVSVISQKIIEPMLQDTMDDFIAQFEKDNGKLTDSSMKILAGMADGAEEAAKVTEAYLEGLKKLGIDVAETSDEAKDGLSKGIQGVTEDTANLLGSYMNAIRQDVSVKRSLIEKLIGDDIPEMNYIAQAQLQELNQIAANTKRNADAADKIYDLVNRVVDKGSNKLKV